MSKAGQPAGEAAVVGPGFTLRRLAPSGQWLISGEDAASGSVVGRDPYAVWLAPGRRLVVAQAPGATPQGPYVADVSDDLALFELAGPRWPDILAMASLADLALLAPGRCLQAMFAGVQALMYRHDDALRLHVERHAAAHLVEWLDRAARGLQGDGP